MTQFTLRHCAAASALVALLSACAEGPGAPDNADGRAMNDDPLTPPGAPGPLQAALPGGEIAADSRTLANLLATGRDSTDAQSYWECTVARAGSATRPVSLRMWEDGRGFRAESAFTWEALSAESARLSFAGNTIDRLDQIRFQDESVPYDRLSARTVTGLDMQCAWQGPSRFTDTQISQQDATAGLDTFVTRASLNGWTCNTQLHSGNASSHFLTFAQNRTGNGSDGPFSWYFHDDSLFISGTTLKVYSRYAVISTGADGSGAPPAFTASVLGQHINCDAS